MYRTRIQERGQWGISVRKVGDELNLYKLGSCHDHAPTCRSMATLHKHRSVARVLSFGVVCRILSDLGTWCGHGAPNGDAIALGGPSALRSVALGVGAAGFPLTACRGGVCCDRALFSSRFVDNGFCCGSGQVVAGEWVAGATVGADGGADFAVGAGGGGAPPGC